MDTTRYSNDLSEVVEADRAHIWHHLIQHKPFETTDPRVIVEVLSESTERFDRGEKFVGYRSLSSLADYLLVAQTQARVEHYTRGGDGTWVLRTLGPGARVQLVAGEIAVDDIYRKVELG